MEISLFDCKVVESCASSLVDTFFSFFVKTKMSLNEYPFWVDKSWFTIFLIAKIVLGNSLLTRTLPWCECEFNSRCGKKTAFESCYENFRCQNSQLKELSCVKLGICFLQNSTAFLQKFMRSDSIGDIGFKENHSVKNLIFKVHQPQRGKAVVSSFKQSGSLSFLITKCKTVIQWLETWVGFVFPSASSIVA